MNLFRTDFPIVRVRVAAAAGLGHLETRLLEERLERSEAGVLGSDRGEGDLLRHGLIVNRTELLQLPGGGDGSDVPGGGVHRQRQVDTDREVVIVAGHLLLVTLLADPLRCEGLQDVLGHLPHRPRRVPHGHRGPGDQPRGGGDRGVLPAQVESHLLLQGQDGLVQLLLNLLLSPRRPRLLSDEIIC